ncbi:MAG: sulfite exporter TauE/SafE family protein [Deltaproteobacteria bacterium]|nr:sulfite exporter TauE/SafE family protein [Deltaproteobacteria bacterium]
MDSIFSELKSALQADTLISSLAALVFAYLGGIVSSFTPCIYPMIPITMGFIGGASERSVRTGWILSSFYVLGMASIYTVLGIIASASGKIFGTMTNTPGWYLALGGIMIVSSLWMMDVIKFDPQIWIEGIMRARRLKKGGLPTAEHNEASILGAFILGASSGFIAAPCTTPVLTTILSYIATTKSVVFGGALMFSFALGLGTILVVVGTFTGAMKLMPKSGKWLSWVKMTSGLLILGLAEYFVFKAGTLK